MSIFNFYGSDPITPQVFVTPDTMMPILSAGALGPRNARSHADSSTESEALQSLERAPFDFVMDAIDSLTPKQLLLAAAHAVNVPVISSMGAGALQLLLLLILLAQKQF